MANQPIFTKFIYQLNSGTLPLTGGELVPIWQGSGTVMVPVSGLPFAMSGTGGGGGAVSGAAYLSSGNVFTAGPQTVTVDAAGHEGLVVKAASGQTALLLDIQASGGVTAVCYDPTTRSFKVGGDRANTAASSGWLGYFAPPLNLFGPDAQYFAGVGRNFFGSLNPVDTTNGESYGFIAVNEANGSDGTNLYALGGITIAKAGVNSSAQVAGTSCVCYVYGTVGNVYGGLDQAAVQTGGTALSLTGHYFAPVIGSLAHVTTDVFGSYTQVLDAGGTVGGTVYGTWIGDVTGIGGASNAYAFWYDSPGVFRIKSDGVMAHYNPAFTKYTPGATSFERVVLQWSGNVAQLMTEAGTSGGTPRSIRLGPQNGLLVSPSGNVSIGGGLSLFSGQTSETISGVRAVSVSQSGYLQIAMASVSGRMPAVGVVIDNVASGSAAAVYKLGTIQYTSGLFTGIGFFGQPVWVGRSGHVAPMSGSFGSGGYASGDIGQKLGVVVGGLLSGTASLNVSLNTFSGGPLGAGTGGVV